MTKFKDWMVNEYLQRNKPKKTLVNEWWENLKDKHRQMLLSKYYQNHHNWKIVSLRTKTIIYNKEHPWQK